MSLTPTTPTLDDLAGDPRLAALAAMGVSPVGTPAAFGQGPESAPPPPSMPAEAGAPDVNLPAGQMPTMPNASPLGPVLARNRWALTKPPGPMQQVPGYGKAMAGVEEGMPGSAQGMTKLGKLLYILKGVGTGALVGSTQPTLGTGFEAAQQNDMQQRQFRMQMEQARANLQFMPLMRAMQLGQMQANIGLKGAQTGQAEARTERYKQLASTQTLAQQYANAVQTAVKAGRNPQQDPDVQSLENSIKATQKQMSAPHTLNLNGHVMQWNPATNAYDKDLGSSAKMNGIPPEVMAQIGEPPIDDPEALKTWGAQAEAIKNREAATLGASRAQAYNASKVLPVITPEGNLGFSTAGEATRQGYAPAGEGSKVLSKQAQFEDIHSAIGSMRSAIDNLGDSEAFSPTQIAKMSLAMRHPDENVSRSLITELANENLTANQREFVNWVRQLNERAMSLRNIAGMGAGAQDLRSAISATLPNVLSGSKEMAHSQLDKFENQVNILQKGIPKIGKTAGGGGNTPAKSQTGHPVGFSPL